jgi:hypothetical protein
MSGIGLESGRSTLQRREAALFGPDAANSDITIILPYSRRTEIVFRRCLQPVQC